MDVAGEVTDKVRVTTESQPLEPATVLLYTPDKVSDWLPKLYDCPSQMLALIELV
jgi:hypothetical protein